MSLPRSPEPVTPAGTRRARLARWLRDCRGSIAVEAVLVLPLLVMTLLAAFVFYDAFRTQKANVTASYTVADLISRQVATVGPAFFEGMHDAFDYLSRSRHPTTVRVSSVYWDVVANQYRVVWSYGTRGTPALTHAMLNQSADRLPHIPRSDTVILLETRMTYAPPMRMGIGSQTFSHFVVTRPRFAPQIAYQAPGGAVAALTPCQQGQVSCGW